MAQIKIAPSILAADFARLGEQVQAVGSAGADIIHIDVMDGRFVPNITMGPLVVEAVRRVTTLPLDVHLMIVEPERYVQKFADSGADWISVHIEASPHLHRTLQMIREAGCKVGVAINPHTPANTLTEVMPLLDVINVMTVNPGFGGQALIKETLPKLAQLKQMIQDEGYEIDLEVDGGVNFETASQVVEAGATVLVAGTTVFGHSGGIQAAIQTLRNTIE